MAKLSTTKPESTIFGSLNIFLAEISRVSLSLDIQHTQLSMDYFYIAIGQTAEKSCFFATKARLTHFKSENSATFGAYRKDGHLQSSSQ